MSLLWELQSFSSISTLSLFLLTLLPVFLILTFFSSSSTKPKKTHFPNSYPLIGSYFAISKNLHRRLEWTASLIHHSPTATYTLHLPFNRRHILSGNPENIRYILKTRFPIYQKGDLFRINLFDFLGDGIFNADGDSWKFQRQLSSHEFSTKSLRFFIESVVESQLSLRFIHILNSSANSQRVLDFQDILQRFAFDNICKIAFGYDPGYLSLSLSKNSFAEAFEEATALSAARLNSPVPLPLFWKIKKFLNIGSEKRLKIAIRQVRDFAISIVKEKKTQQFKNTSSQESADLLSRFLSSDRGGEEFIIDIVISFILAGRDTTSAALTWFFYLLYKNPRVEDEILKEIKTKKKNLSEFDEVRDMVYTHGALCESMRLYPPVPTDSKMAMVDDVLPDGTLVKKGDRIQYHPYAMGRSEKLWGPDWEEFKPERWLEKTEEDGNWKFVGRDPYSYPVFQAGPRICLGKEMAFLQMKRLVGGVLEKYRVVPVLEDGVEPVFVSGLTSKMKGGFPVRIEERKTL